MSNDAASTDAGHDDTTSSVGHRDPSEFGMMKRQLRTFFPIHALDTEGRRLMGIIWLVGLLQGLCQAPLAAMLTYVRSGLELTQGDMSQIMAVTRLASLGAVAFTLWGDRRGRRGPLIVALVVLLAASALTALVNAGDTLALAQSVVRLAAQAVGTLAVVLIGERLPNTVRAFGIGLYAAAGSVGAGATQLMLPLASRSPDAWRYVFLVPVAGMLLLPFILRLSESPLVHADDATPDLARLRAVLFGPTSRLFWIAAGASLLAAVFPVVALNFTNERLIGELGMGSGRVALIALSGGTIGGLGFWIGGRMADTVGRKAATLLALAASTIGGIALFSVTSVPAIFAAIVIGSFGTFAYVPAAATHRVELFPTWIRATAGSAAGYLATIGSAIGLGIGSLTIDRIGLDQTMLVLTVPTVLAAALTLLLPETLHHSLEAADAP